MVESVMEGTVAIVPLRAGSKGMPGKNIRPLAGRPLYRHAIEQAREAGITRILISTDIESVLSAPSEDGLVVYQRPKHLAGDAVAMNAVLRYILTENLTGSARVALLQATSPLRAPGDIISAIKLHAKGQFDLVLTATRTDSAILKCGRSKEDEFVPLSDPEHCFSNRGELPPAFRPNGAGYVFDADWFRRYGNLAAGRIGFVEMPADRSIDIDAHDDFMRASIAMNGRVNDGE